MQPLASAEAAAEPVVEPGPFKFLDHYADTPQDRLRFGGREREVREITARITNEATLVLYGRSGIGKTSLLLAGVFPELRDRGYRPIYVRTLTAPLDDLTRRVARECSLPEAGGSVLALIAQAIAAVGPIVLVLDQFEEFFIRFREKPAMRTEFVEAIAAVVKDQDLDATVVFSLREDYLAQLDDFRRELPGLFDNEYRLRALTAFGVRQAILKPLVEADVPYEEAVISKLVDQLEDFGFDPPVLQIICSELYKEAVRRAEVDVPRITLDDLRRVGGLDGIFRRYLDGVTEAVPKERHLLARMVLDALISRDSTKQAATLDDLLVAGFSAEPGEVRAILETLMKQRLLRSEEREGEEWYELIHERLVPNVREWLDLDRPFFEFRQARRFVRNNSEGDLWRRDPDALLNPGVLSGLIARYRERFRFDDTELEFVVRSAVVRRSDSVRFWAERCGVERTLTLLQELAAAPDESERLGAAAAAPAFPEAADRLAPLCLGLALGDPSEEVRRAAGLSLAPLARGDEELALRDALRRTPVSRQAREALTNMAAGGHRLAGFDLLRRWRARHRAQKRLLHEKRDIIRARRRTGAASGFVGAAAWVATVGFALALLSAAIFAPVIDLTQWLVSLSMTLAYGGMLTLLLGAVVGWLCAGAAAKDAALHGEGKWFRAWLRRLDGSEGLLILAALLLSPLLLLTCVSFLIVPALLLPALLLPLGSSTARLIRDAVWPGVPARQLWLWGLLASAGVPLLLPLLLLTPLAALFPELGLRDFTWAAAIASSFAAFVAAVALARSSERRPFGALPACPPARRRQHRALAVAAALGVLVWFAGLYGRDAVPLLAPGFEYDERTGFSRTSSLGPLFPDVQYFKVHNGTGRVRIAEVTVREAPGGPESAGHVQFGYAVLGEILLLPPGSTWGHFSLDKPAAGEGRLTLQPAKLLTPGPDGRFHLSSGEKGVVRLALQPLSPGHWHATLAGQLGGSQQPDEFRRIEVATAWDELRPGPAHVEVRDRRSGGILKPAEASDAAIGREVSAGGEVILRFARTPELRTLPSSADVTWSVQPDAGAWSLEIRAWVDPGRVRLLSQQRPEVFVMLQEWTAE